MRQVVIYIALAAVLLLPLATYPFLGMVTLQWQVNSTNEDGFKIQQSINGGPWVNALTIAIPKTNHATAWTIPGWTYCWRVVAYSVKSGDAAPSNVDCKRFIVE